MNVAQNARDTASAQKIDKGREPPRLAYSVAEIVARTSLSRSSIYKAIRLRRLRSFLIGARRIIRPEDLQRWLEGLSPTSD